MNEDQFSKRIEWMEEYAEILRHLPLTITGLPASRIISSGISAMQDDKFGLDNCRQM